MAAKPPPEQPSWVQTLVYVLAWIVAVGLLIVLMILIRGLVMDTMTIIGLLQASADPEQWRATRLTYGWIKATVDRSLLLVLACAGLGLVIGVETYFRQGIPKGQLYRRIKRVMIIEVAIGAAAWTLSTFFTWIMLRLPGG
ncbi:MAG: hypothetical protein JXC32_21885 [Anaerolineae bacterium]|nr:hypothetical protein [Anaerolineae bacterium]